MMAHVAPKLGIADGRAGWTPRPSPASRPALPTLLWSQLEHWDGLGYLSQYMEELKILRASQGGHKDEEGSRESH